MFLEEAKKLGDELVVIVSSDKIASKIKKDFLLPQEQRAEMVGALKIVDKVFIGDENDTLALLPQIRPDIIALGYDQKVDEAQLQSSLASRGTRACIVRIKKKREGDFLSTSKIIKKICEVVSSRKSIK